jgi:hypothetical protein
LQDVANVLQEFGGYTQVLPTQVPEQHSLDVAHKLPSLRQASAHLPLTQLPEQHPAGPEQFEPAACDVGQRNRPNPEQPSNPHDEHSSVSELQCAPAIHSFVGVSVQFAPIGSWDAQIPEGD